jgi:hypothetical protein
MAAWTLVGISCIALGLYIRDKSLLLKDNGKWCFKFIKTKNIKRGD